MEEGKKHIDESWKESVAKEKDTPQEGQESMPPEASFSFFVSTLALQASIFIPWPTTSFLYWAVPAFPARLSRWA